MIPNAAMVENIPCCKSMSGFRFNLWEKKKNNEQSVRLMNIRIQLHGVKQSIMAEKELKTI